METTFCELKGKEVINVIDGKRLGRIIDIVFDSCCGRILGLVVPAYTKSFNIFKTCDDIFIPYANVCKIGEDVILVRICVQNPKVAMLGSCKTKYTKAMGVEEEKTAEQNVDAQNESGTNIYPEMQTKDDDTKP